MRTTTNVHTQQQRAAQRENARRLTLQSQWRLILCVSILRTAVTQVLPLCGAAGWWVTLICLAPALLLYALGRFALRKAGASTLTECVRRLPGGCVLLHGMIVMALLAEGAANMTALITLFTQGIGARGTQITLAAVALGMLILCLKGEGVQRGIYLIRWLLLALLLLSCAGLLDLAETDHVWPALGGGWADVQAAVRSGLGMGWPLLLALVEERPAACRAWQPLPPVLVCAAVIISINLAFPHELLTIRPALADSLVLTVSFQPPLLRLTTICLWMAGLFLAIAASANLGAKYALAPSGRELVWLPGVLAALLAATQLVDVHALWQGIGAVLPWLLAPMALGVLPAFIACWRKRT